MTERPFKTEADLCAAFIAWAQQAGVKCYAEWAGWDILLVYPDGLQLGIQAKLRLNADVILQAVPDLQFMDDTGPDFRGVLVPQPRAPMYSLASRLGLVAFWPGYEGRFHPRLVPDADWLDWNPARRHDLPPTETDAIAGSPCPVTLTPWKLAALDVLAEIETRGTITTKRMRALQVNPSRWLAALWLMPAEKRGDWVRGGRCPKFDEQHPTAYALALEKARKTTESAA